MMEEMESLGDAAGDISTSHGGEKESGGDFMAGANDNIGARFADLVIFRNQAQRRIAELEGTVKKLEQMLSEARRGSDAVGTSLRRTGSAPILNQPFKTMGMEQISEWNSILVATIEEQRSSMLKMEMDAKLQAILLGDKVEQLQTEIKTLKHENNALKERVANDVLQQRQTDRIEMAFEKARIASQVRAAGLRRLECMEAVLMETHDDLYYVQRCDAMILPVRDVTFVLHVVANVSAAHASAEDFTRNIYQQLLLNTARKYRGYHVCGNQQLEIFSFHSATAALHFSKECHVGVTGIAWPSRTTDISYFSPVIDNGEVLYSGPRMHTCMYTCNPGSEVNPINGRAVYYGTEIHDAVMTTLQSAAVGEIVANVAWGELFCKESIITSDVHSAVTVSVQSIRERLGDSWSVAELNPPEENLLCSILPRVLERRRGLPPYYLHPAPRFPRDLIDAEYFIPRVIPLMKGVTQLTPNCTQQKQQQSAQDCWIESLSHHEENVTVERDTNGADILELYSLRRERGKITHLYKKLEAITAFHEQIAMEREDQYLASLLTVNPSDVFYIFTVDIGDDAFWRKITREMLDENEHRQMRDRLLSSVLSGGGKNNGVHINGNNRDVFTFAFRQPEEALRFAAYVYTLVAQNCETFSKIDMCFARGGITTGTLHLMCNKPTFTHIANSACGGMVWCCGAAVSTSGALCGTAGGGEFFVTADVLQAFHSNRKNLASMEFNFLRHGGRFLKENFKLVDVYSFLPKPYAYRRQRQVVAGERGAELWWESPHRCVKAELKLEEDFMHREEVHQLLLQQQQLMERAEAAAMASHDNAWDMTARNALRLPWPVAGKLGFSRERTDLGFLFCDAVDIVDIASSVSSELFKDIIAQYNYVVQRAVLDHDGFVSQTDSKSMYIIIFREPCHALESALQIQRNLMAVEWPARLLTLEASLRVQSSNTGTLLFHGVRSKMVVHVSRDYQCTHAPQYESDDECISVFGPAIDIVATIGPHARGGEIILTPSALHGIQITLHGALLLQQLAMREAVVRSPADGALLSCVPKKLWERLDLFVTLTNSASSMRTSDGRRTRNAKRVSWGQDTKGIMLPLPPARMLMGGYMTSVPCSAFPTALLQSIENALSHIKHEMAVSIDTDPCRDGFMRLSHDVLGGLSTVLANVENSLHKAPLTTDIPTSQGIAAVASVTTSMGATTRTKATKLGSDLSVSLLSGKQTPLGMRNTGSRVPLPMVRPSEAGDLYKGALQFLENILKGVLERCSLTLGGSVSSLKKRAFQSLSSLTRGQSRNPRPN